MKIREINILGEDINKIEKELIREELKEYNIENFEKDEMVYLESGSLCYLGYNLKVLENNNRVFTVKKINYWKK